jgi:peptidoglycan hydrolase CwlO-like protein
MKNRFLTIFVAVLFIFIGNPFAQSDYEIVQNFKTKYREIENNLKYSASLDELNAVSAKIDQLKQEFAQHKDLLDKSLYPDNYAKFFENLDTAYVMRQDAFTTIDELQTEVVVLEQEVEDLNKRNKQIIVMIDELETLRKKDKKNTAELENLIENLRNSLRQRDRLVVEMLDNLIPPIMREKATLSAEDKRIVRRVENNKAVLQNVKVSIKDNIRFLEATSLNPDDIKTIKEQQEQFSDTWKAIGPKLVDVYADRENKADELKEIDSLFIHWYYNSIDQNVWSSIRNEFRAHGIILNEFNYGNEFVHSVKLFIEDEIKNLGVKSEEASEKTYVSFTDSTWFAAIKPMWVPYLIEGGLFTVEEKDEVEASIEEWKSELYPSKLWLYILIWFAIVIILLPAIILLIRRRKKSQLEFKDIANE